ncbi:MAG: YHS domain-containing protein, partial [Elusimicrobia bacterium]|nr:YHS domain-containing protein [Elusimicrobiota bacterium]MBD3412184.1 YHS domain-containing protein [Elusimicrobiota bacterium]
MAIDPVCGMQVNEAKGEYLHHNGKDLYFCSKACLQKYKSDHGIETERDNNSCCTHRHVWWKNKNIIVAAIILIGVVLSYGIPFLRAFRETFFMYGSMIWWALILGLLLGGLIDHYIPRQYISKVLARPGKQAILNAVILGFLMSACSHGILALSIELHKKGASNPAVVAFLLASPWANIPLTILLIGFFGYGSLFIIGSAILIALITGFIFQILESKKLIETNTNSITVDQQFSIIRDIKHRYANYRFSLSRFYHDMKGILSGAVSLGNMVVWWILIGITIASVAGAYVPDEIFSNYMGPTIIGLVVTLAVATVIEVCSEGSAPMAFEIFRQTGALGNSFVFLMAGVVTDYTEIGLIWHNVGRK